VAYATKTATVDARRSIAPFPSAMNRFDTAATRQVVFFFSDSRHVMIHERESS